MTTSSCWVRSYNSTPSPTVLSTPVNRTVERDSAVSSPWPRKEFDWNGDVATRVDCVPQRLNSLRNIYAKR